MYYIHVLHTAPYSCQPDRLATLRFSASSVVWDSWDSGHCSLSICDYRLSWTNTVSEAKIQITLLILRRGALSSFRLCPSPQILANLAVRCFIHLLPGGKESRSFLKANKIEKWTLYWLSFYLDWVRFDLQSKKVATWSDLKINVESWHPETTNI